jgi:hypothetical protein
MAPTPYKPYGKEPLVLILGQAPRHPPCLSKEQVLETLHLKLRAPQICPDRQQREGKNSKDDLCMQEERSA